MNSEEKIGELEALLFIHGEPLSFKRAAVLLNTDVAAVKELVGILKSELSSKRRGIDLMEDGEKIQLVTKPAFHKILEKFVKEEMTEDLTPASLETLAIISYFSPISRARIEYLRGVNSSFILRSLLVRGLIERLPDPEHASTFLYRPTFDLFKHLGLKQKEDLPDFGKFRELLKVFESSPGAGSAAEDQPAGAANRDGDKK